MPDRELVLVADIGGTNTRVALGDTAGGLHGLRVLQNTDIDDLHTLFAETIGAGGSRVASAVLALAGPVDGDEVRLTNHPWTISRTGLEHSLGLRRLILVNDFLAAAHAMPVLDERDLIGIQTGEAAGRSGILVCGPGTGFGAAALIDSDGRKTGIASEAGHMVLGATSPEEIELFSRIAQDRPIVVEDVVSGTGLVSLHRALSQTVATSEEIIASAQAGDGAACKAIAAFMNVFGRIAGDLALAYNALGGVYIVGGVGRALAPMYERSGFLESFCNHPPYEDRLRRAPLCVVTHDQPGLVGALQIGIAAR